MAQKKIREIENSVVVEAAYCTFTRWWESKLRRYAKNLAYGILRDREESEDIAQEAYFRMLRTIGRDPTKVETYDGCRNVLHRVALRLCLDRLRVVRRSPAIVSLDKPLSGNENGDIVYFTPSDSATPVDDLEVSLVVAKLANRIENPGEKSIFLLLCEGQNSDEEIAGILGLPVGTVKSRIYRLRKKLVTVFLEEGLDPQTALWLELVDEEAWRRSKPSNGTTPSRFDNRLTIQDLAEAFLAASRTF